ncbi:MAG: hypothetical protein KAJ31_04165 [Deltaproteobacteria bacterium]|nr:hypothetical protein [Deltaproteobacteria bacterium]
MQKLCTKCNFIGKGKHGLLSGNLYVGILEVAFAVLILKFGGDFMGSFIYGAVVAAIIAIAGIINIIDSYSDGRLCSSCGKDNMIPLDSLQADEIIREKNLTLPEDTET